MNIKELNEKLLKIQNSTLYYSIGCMWGLTPFMIVLVTMAPVDSTVSVPYFFVNTGYLLLFAVLSAIPFFLINRSARNETLKEIHYAGYLGIINIAVVTFIPIEEAEMTRKFFYISIYSFLFIVQSIFLAYCYRYRSKIKNAFALGLLPVVALFILIKLVEIIASIIKKV